MEKQEKANYPMRIAANRLGLHPQTLRLYEKQGLIIPRRRKGRRYFSDEDLRWIRCIREIIHKKAISIPGLKRLLAFAPCWELRDCPMESREECSAFIGRSLPCWECVKFACSRLIDNCQECEFYQANYYKYHLRLKKVGKQI